MPFKSNIYNVNWKKLARWITPNKLAFPKTMALIYAIISCINYLHSKFLNFRNYINYRLSITPQIVYLENLLNDRFDVVDRRIRIAKGIEYPALPLFLKIENKLVKLYKKTERPDGIHHAPKVFYTKSETEQFTVDFIVRVPILVSFDMDELTAYLDIDVMPSKVYKVQIV